MTSLDQAQLTLPRTSTTAHVVVKGKKENKRRLKYFLHSFLERLELKIEILLKAAAKPVPMFADLRNFLFNGSMGMNTFQPR